MAITDDILAQLGTGKLEEIAQQLGLETTQVKSVLTDAIPALVGGLSANVQSGDGAASLASALSDHASANPLGNIGDLVSGALGSGILEHVLGGKVPDISGALAGKNGTSPVDVQRILAIAAPLVMALLGKQIAGGGKPDPTTVQKEVEAQGQKLPDLGSILGGLLGK